MNSRTVVLIVVIAIVGLSILEWRPWHEPVIPENSTSSQIQSSGTPPTRITSAEISTSNTFETSVRAQLTAANYTTIASEISAKVALVQYKDGESFKKNDTLIKLECSIQSAQLERAQAAFNISQRNYLANRKLLNHGAVSRLEVENAESELQKSSAELAELKAINSKCVITAPFDGKVVEQRIRPEQFVQAGQAILEILDQSSLEVEFIAPSYWYAAVKINDILHIDIDETKKTYPIKVDRIGAKIDAISQTVKITAVIDGSFKELTPGMSGSIKNTNLVPR